MSLETFDWRATLSGEQYDGVGTGGFHPGSVGGVRTKNRRKKSVFGVFEGRRIGVVRNWTDCHDLVNEYSGASFKKFKSIEDAQERWTEQGLAGRIPIVDMVEFRSVQRESSSSMSMAADHHDNLFETPGRYGKHVDIVDRSHQAEREQPREQRRMADQGSSESRIVIKQRRLLFKTHDVLQTPREHIVRERTVRERTAALDLDFEERLHRLRAEYEEQRASVELLRDRGAATEHNQMAAVVVQGQSWTHRAADAAPRAGDGQPPPTASKRKRKSRWDQ